MGQHENHEQQAAQRSGEPQPSSFQHELTSNPRETMNVIRQQQNPQATRYASAEYTTGTQYQQHPQRAAAIPNYSSSESTAGTTGTQQYQRRPVSYSPTTNYTSTENTTNTAYQTRIANNNIHNRTSINNTQNTEGSYNTATTQNRNTNSGNRNSYNTAENTYSNSGNSNRNQTNITDNNYTYNNSNNRYGGGGNYGGGNYGGGNYGRGGGDYHRGFNPALLGLTVGLGALDASLYGNGYYNGINNGYYNGINNGYYNGGINNGYDGGLNNGYENPQVVQRLAFDLRNGNQDDAANLINRELNVDPGAALQELHQANELAGPGSPDRIRRIGDDIVVTDSYSQTQEFAGRINRYDGYSQRSGYDRNRGYDYDRNRDYGRLPGAQIGNYYDTGVDNSYYAGSNNGYYNGVDNGNYNGYYNGTNNTYAPVYNGVSGGDYLAGAAINGVTAGVTVGLLSSLFRGRRERW